MSLLNTFIACIRHLLSSCYICLTLPLVPAVEMKDRVFHFSTSVQIPGAFVKSLRWLLEASMTLLMTSPIKMRSTFSQGSLKWTLHTQLCGFSFPMRPGSGNCFYSNRMSFN